MNRDPFEALNLVAQRRLRGLFNPQPPPRPAASGAPQVNSWTDLCFLRQSFAPGSQPNWELVYTTFAAVDESDHLFFGHAPFKISDISFAQITASLEPVPDDHLYPIVPSVYEFTIAPRDLPLSAVYVKRNLGHYEDYLDRNLGRGAQAPAPAELPPRLLSEARILEVISRSESGPHPNIVEYLGVRINLSRITGLVMRRYEYNIYSYLQLGIGTMTMDEKDKFMEVLEDAVLRYLHEELGVAHNDINPFNVMVDVREGMVVPVLGGFGEARKIGERIGEKIGGERGMLPGWTWRDEREEYMTSEVRHDVSALGKEKL
ncbi:hypothetical protein B0H65DRAFT_550267 [Neurospora tetraspora]|uniref:Protein kinase domain-containing protein n=1 Tax=Neurospora tetraspora TaxID=94610 RepID=A0AAE0JEN9_9PEZI|nr:hypothetical protein B0H65DRAFT_550267 [Neurospora tetraspora]